MLSTHRLMAIQKGMVFSVKDRVCGRVDRKMIAGLYCLRLKEIHRKEPFKSFLAGKGARSMHFKIGQL